MPATDNNPDIQTYPGWGSGNVHSNAFQQAKVLNALVGRIGWLQPTVSGSVTLTAPNTTSNSGAFFQDFHAVVTPGNIWAVQEDGNITADNFNAFLLQKQKAAIMKALRGVFGKREHLERKLLFERFGRQDYQNTNTGYFVGLRILPPRDFRTMVQIDELSLYFDTTVTFNLYLFHDAKREPIWSQSVSATAWMQTIVQFSDFFLNYNQFAKGGVYYLGYFQNDLGDAMAINEIVERFNPLFEFGITPVELQDVSNDQQVNFNYVAYTTKTHGLNIQCSAYRDHTQEILAAPYAFDTLIGLQMAADVIEMIENATSRSSMTERISKEVAAKLYTDLNQAFPTKEMPWTAGLRNQIARETRRVRDEFFPPKKPMTVDHDTSDIDQYGIPDLNVFKY